MEIFKKIIPLIFVILFSLLTLKPLLIPGFFPMHDDTQPARVYEMAKALTDGQFPVRWVPDLGYGYGYPLFNFYAPLPYYTGALFHLIGFDLLSATKLMFGIGLLLAAITMYFLAKKMWGTFGGITSALFYMYAPYHAVQLYVRGAVGEFWAYAFLPLVGLGILEIYDHKYKKGIALGVLGFSGIILSHNISALMTGLFLGLWLILQILISLVKPKLFVFLLPLLAFILLSISLTAFFWLPAVGEASLTKVAALATGSNDYHLHFVDVDQLWDWPWGFAGSAPGRTDGLSFKIGKLHILTAAIGSLVLLFVAKTTKNKQYLFKGASLLPGAAFSFFMITPYSVWIWEGLGVLKYVQYSWRFLSFGLFFTCLLAGALLTTVTSKKNPSIISLTLLVIIFTLLLVYNVRFFQPQFIVPVADADYTSDVALTWKISKISDEYLPYQFPIPRTISDTASTKISASDAIMVESTDVVSNRITTVVSAKTPAEIVFSIAYFPGWQVVVDGQRIAPQLNQGKLAVNVPSGKHIITAYFTDTLVRIIGNIITIITLVVCSGLLLKLNYEKNE